MVNTELELDIEAIGFEGISVAKKDGLVYFVKGGVPGDKIIANIRSKKRRYFNASIKEILEPSPNRVEPVCSHFGTCGGCSWQNLSYQEQISWKRTHIIDAYQRIGKVEAGEYLPALASPLEFNYRNKMEFTFGTQRWLTTEEINTNEIVQRDFALGLHIPGRYDKILDIDKCYIHPNEFNEILTFVRNKAKEYNITAYNSHTVSGFLRNLVCRKSFYEDKSLIILVTNSISSESEQQFIDAIFLELQSEIPSISGFIHAVNSTKSPVAVGEISRVAGEDYLTEKILDIEYRISPFSFFQTNSSQLTPFISKIIEFAEFQPEDTVWDFYCGAGSITLPSAKFVNKIYGFELSESSINDAKDNMKLNNIENAHFDRLDLNAKNISDEISKYPTPDIIILDPPRAGLHNNTVSALLSVLPERIVYVSCNPSTQARDLALLADNYVITKVLPVDMFPHTYHIESIAQLVRKDNA
jgi:23S rRNA (uracil1939-C5)-methyltransferase